MSGKGKDWADDDDSSIEGSDEEEEILDNTREPVPNFAQPQQVEESVLKEPSTGGPYVAHIGNLLYSIDENYLRTFFEKRGCHVQDVRIHKNETGRSKGSAHVEFRDNASLDTALNANDFEFERRRITVSVGNKPQRGGGAYRRDGDRRPRDNRDGYRSRSRDNREGGGRGRGYERGNDSRGRGYDARRSGGRGRDSRPVSEPIQPTGGSSEPPATRKKIEIKPRTLPIEQVGAPTAAPTGIFGEGKPRDELALQKKAEVPPPAPVQENTTPPVPPTKAEEADVVNSSAVTGVSSTVSKEAPKNVDTSKEGRREKSVRGGRGGRGEGSRRPQRGEGRGDARGAGRGNKPKTKPSDTPAEAAQSNKTRKDKMDDSEEARLLKFTQAQEKMARKESAVRSQDSRKNSQQVVNAFGALQMDDDSDDENSS
mmetsp:Transcript_16822/g.25293  ORF Transcript_16822/g.25293 Transcript_16822/m.25293 type:complete len:427 (-) Transcript_16822:153-1433(-)|eukprot:CAMPEP_0185026474 /NCGR_PEP_ID=MMETSP1103-20130426/10735_1 /TAXON_ID=36769 /ORGANISM="Paraphysomonas bandaiensis, Strain Caron Lab Isolate" /LENGTH=426 /DNA_ID=CAMNT_0027560073 /DNA_START=43 /DNA_END=1323 /DNA_ORIENTATION=+